MLHSLQPIELNNDFKYTLELLENKENKSVFITGRAGTGKSTLLRLFRTTTKKKVVVLAPTGLAALNVNGQTIHSFFGFPPKMLQKKDIRSRRNKKLYKKIDAIIIDEISMVRADMLDNIDYFMRLNGRNSSLPFGGAQMIFFGDLFQLPPVVTRDDYAVLKMQGYEHPYFFSAIVFREMELELVELNKVYRQEQRFFLQLLDAVRTNQMDYDVLEDLNVRHIPTVLADSGYITLSSRNSIVNEINSNRLKRLNTKEFTYLGSVSGKFSERVFPTSIALTLKEGSQVMFVKNDPRRRFVNGTIGRVKELHFNKIFVVIEKEGTTKTIEVEQAEWEIKKYKADETTDKIETESIGSFKQYPLKLAWAITIHKAQGKTFDKIIIDLGRGAFEHGQTYVALSRCTTLEGIILKHPLKFKDVIIDDAVVEFYESNF